MYILKRTFFMEDEKFIKELKDTIKGKKLPTLGDLGGGYVSPIKEIAPSKKGHLEYSDEDAEVEITIEREPYKKQEVEEKKQDIEEKGITRKVCSDNELVDKVESLHDKGKTIDEIYATLKLQGYEYEEIEEAILKLIKEEKSEPISFETEKPIEKSKLEKKEFSEIPKPNVKKIHIEDKSEEEFAPLFVKVGKYKETLETLGNLENYLNGMSKLFELATQLEKVRESNISAMNKMFEKANMTASKLYAGLLKPKGMKLEGTIESKTSLENMEEVISELTKELTILKEEVDKIRELE